MARKFTPKEAKELILQHNTMQTALSALAGLPARYRSDADGEVRALTEQGVFSGLVLRGEAPGDRADTLFAALYRYRMSLPAALNAKTLLQQNRGAVSQRLRALESVTGRWQWLLAPAKTRETAQNAYDWLREQAEGGLGAEVRRLSADVDALRNTDAETIRADIAAHAAAYEKLLAELCPASADASAGPFAELLQGHDELSDAVESCETAAEANRVRIGEAAGRMTAEEVMDILKDVPVEELNREKGGVRVKTLRDSGYETIADLCAASVYQLASLNGISEGGAFAIKKAVREFASQAAEGVKIRLDPDDRTGESTALLAAIRTCRRRQADHDALREVISAEKTNIEGARRLLERVGCGAGWLFLSDEQRALTKEAAGELQSLLDGEYAQKLWDISASLEQEEELSDDELWQDFEDDTAGYYAALESVAPDILGGSDGIYGLPEDLALTIRDEEIFPDGLLCTLRRYQEWGVKYILHQGRVLLGDEMGLGKTVQAIAAMVSLRNTGATHFVVVCPASVLTNWCREITKHSRLRPTKIHGADREAALASWLRTGGVAVTTYETTAYFQLDDGYRFDMLTVDEAHYIKNPGTHRTANVKRLCGHAERILFMTGTALENRVDEMIALIRILRPELALKLRAMSFMSAAPHFREAIAPVYYRRRREDVLTELPDLIDAKEWCTLGKEEEKSYEEAVLRKNYAAARRVSWNVGDLSLSCKANRMRELIDEAAEDGRKILVFSFFLETLDSVKALLGETCYGPINGSVPPAKRQQIVDEFNDAPAGSVLVAQVQSGGTGLNIQAASVVILCEPQFKPSVENQAISRAYRMGQAHSVLVYRLLCEKTVDERVIEILDLKQDVFDAFADPSAAADQSSEVDETSFAEIIREEIDRINAKHAEDTEAAASSEIAENDGFDAETPAPAGVIP